MKTTLTFEYWAVGRGSYWLQSRSQAVSSYLRTLKCLRKVGYAVAGDHMTLWSFDGTERKLRSILRGVGAVLTKHDSVSVESQPEARRGRRVARRPCLPSLTLRRRSGRNSCSRCTRNSQTSDPAPLPCKQA